MFNTKMLSFAICLGVLISTVSAFPSEPSNSASPQDTENSLAQETLDKSENKLEQQQNANESAQPADASAQPGAPAASDSDQNQEATHDPQAEKQKRKRNLLQKAIDRTRKFLDKLDSVLYALGFPPSETGKYHHKYQQVASLSNAIASIRAYPPFDDDLYEWESLVDQVVERVEEATSQLDQLLP